MTKNKKVDSAMNILRKMGNKSGHDGTLNFSIEEADRMFWLLNYIVERTITDNNRLNEIQNKF